MSENTEISSWKYIEPCNFSGYSIIIPSVAVGNVAQLTCDLLISSLQMKKTVSIYTTALIPVLGYDPYNLQSNELSSSCELYTCTDRKLAVLQLRAPLIYKYASIFLNDFVNKLKEMNIREIIILTSSFAHERKHVMTSPFRYVSNSLYGSEEKLKRLQCLKHENIEPELKIFGGGFASLLYGICKDSVACLLLYKYCSEGDNIPDAYDLIQLLSNFVTLFPENNDIAAHLIQPVSWKLLFGKPAPLNIY